MKDPQTQLRAELVLLLENNRHTEELFLRAAQKAEMPQLVLWLIWRATQRAVFQIELKGAMPHDTLPNTPTPSDSTPPPDPWIDRTALFLTAGDEILFKEVMLSEKRALKEYVGILKIQHIPVQTAIMLSSQRTEIELGLSQLRDLDMLK